MTVLVTGAAGFLGRATLRALAERGVERVRAFVRPGTDTAFVDALAERFGDTRFEVAHGNLLDAAAVKEATRRVDVVCHLAAAMRGSPADMVLNTVVATRNVLDAVAHRKRLRLVLVSSLGIYGTATLPARSRIDEETPLEPHPQRRDPYTFSKWRQEALAREHAAAHDYDLVVLRPGVIYGPDSQAEISARVGVKLFGVLLHFGRSAPLPLTYVDNCADAVALAALAEAARGGTFNVIDDDVPTCAEYLRRYRREVERVPAVPVPYPLAMALSRAVEAYHRRSQGQLPAVFTPYKTAATWKPHVYAAERIRAIGWRPRVPTGEALERTFAAWRERRRRS